MAVESYAPPTGIGTLEPPPGGGGPPVTFGRRPSRGLAIAMTILTGLWVVGVITLGHAVGWLLVEVLTELERPTPFWLSPAVGWVAALAAAVPAVLLAVLSRLDFARWAGNGWLVAAVAGGLLGTARLIQPPFHEVYLAALALVACALALTRLGLTGSATGARRTLLSIAGGLASLIPWLWIGALGGALETLLAAGAALAIGWLASRRLAPLLQVGGGIRSRWGRTVTTGLVLGVAVVALAAGIGETGVQLLALVALPPLAFVAAALRRPSLTALLGVAVFGPLAFVDPEETSLVLGTADVGRWALVGSACALVAALVVAIPYTAVLGGGRQPRRNTAGLVAAVVAAATAVVYVWPGHPGLYGERVFAVMKQQADLGGLSSIANREERLRQTYRRLVDTAERSQESIRRQLRDQRLSFRSYYLVNGIEVAGGQAVRGWLARRDDVDRVLLNPRLRPIPRAAPVMRGTEQQPDRPQWNLTVLQAERVWHELGVTGAGVVVGGSDSGVDGAHPALRGKFRGGDDSWLDPSTAQDSSSPTQPIDHNGHGTHTLATAVGADVGVAPGARWIGCVNLPRNFGNPASYLTCLQFMLAPYPRGGDPMHDGRPERAPHVLTNSWGCTELEGCDEGSLRQAVAALTAAGLYFVAGAGNTGPYCGSVQDPPAIYPDALAVGAVDENGALTDFSSRGPAPGGLAKPDILAPGEHVLSAFPGGGYGYLDGTSMAAPHVAGVVALMWSANPELVGDIPRTTQILRRTAKPVRAAGKTCDGTGAGRVDAYAAVTEGGGHT